MLSIYTLKSAQDASKYYQKEDYYAKENNVTDAHSAWLGKGAKKLLLYGEVDAEEFKQVLEGKLPNGVVMQKAQGKHRPGYDLTFSAPKSVSILGIVGEDKNVIQAHRNAVSEVLSHIEKKYGAVRTKKNGSVNVEKTDNLAFATFEHTDSRKVDPNLHTHCVLMNFSQRKDGQWRTLYGDALYNDKLLNGMVYRSFLAKNLKAQGYEIVQTTEDGTFELAGFKEPIIKQFSKRRHEIEAALDKMGQSCGKAASMANFMTRGKKMDLPIGELKLRWEHELKECGYSLEYLQTFTKAAIERGPIKAKDSKELAKKAVDSALNHLSEKKSIFTTQDVLKTALGLSLMSCDSVQLMTDITSRIEAGDIISLEKNYLITKESKDLESKLINLMREDKKQVQPIQGPIASSFAGRLSLKEKPQREALQHLLTSRDRQNAIQSSSKEEYYKVIKVFNAVCKDNYYYPTILTQSNIQQEEAKNLSGINRAFTVAGFLEICNNRAEKTQHKPVKSSRKFEARQVWIIDPSAKVSVKQSVALQEWARHFGARIVWSKTDRTNPVTSFLIEEGIRSKSSRGSPKKANHSEETLVLSTILDKLQSEGRIEFFTEHQDRITCAVGKYISKQSSGTALFVATHSDLVQVNSCIRDKLILNESLGKESAQAISLQPLNFTDEQKRLVHLYQNNDVIHYRNGSKTNNIAKDSYYVVNNIDIKEGVLLLTGEGDKVVRWDPNKASLKKTDVYRAEMRELRVGDKMVWTKTVLHEDPALNRYKSESAKVISIEKDIIMVSLKNGTNYSLDTRDLKQAHFDYDYASMLSQANNNKYEHGLLLMTSHQASFLSPHAITSVINNAKEINVICDDVQKLEKNLLAQTINPQLIVQTNEVPFDQKDAVLQSAEIIKESLPFARLQGVVNEVIEKCKLENETSTDEKLIAGFERKASMTDNEKIAYEAVDYVCSKLTEREAVFSLEKAQEEAFKLIGIKISQEELNEAFNTAFKEGFLIKTEKYLTVGDKKMSMVSTKGMVLMEKGCLQLVNNLQGSIEPILTSDHVSLTAIDNNTRLTQGQKDAIYLSLITNDQVIGIQGVAGAGKTTMLKEVNHCSVQSGYRMLGLANTAGARNRIIEATKTYENAGIPAITTRKFINHAEKLLSQGVEQAKALYGRNQILVLDEASLASTRDMFTLLTLTQKLEARLLLIGDVKQLGPIEAGNPWHLMLGSNMKSVSMAENVRFKDPETVNIMRDLYATRIEDAIDKLMLNTVEIPDKDERFTAMANLYVEQPSADQKNTLIISPKNEDRIAINEKVREALNINSLLQGEDIKTSVLLPKDMNHIEKNTFYAYDQGDLIRFNYSNKMLGIKSGDYWEVSQKDPDTQRILLIGPEEREISWSPQNLPKWSGAIEVFSRHNKKLKVGEKIRWKRNDESRGITNGDVAEMLKIKDAVGQVRLRDGKEIEIDLNRYENNHWDHAYTSTVFVAQGQDVPLTLGNCQAAAPKSRKTEELCINDVIVLPNGAEYFLKQSDKASQEKQIYEGLSKVVLVSYKDDKILTLKDREGNEYTFSNNKVIKNTWTYYPPFESTFLSENGKNLSRLPKSTNLSGFLVQATRGDSFIMYVDNVDYFKKTLAMQTDLKETVMQYLDPEWYKAAQKVAKMTENVTGKALELQKKTDLKSDLESPISGGATLIGSRLKDPKMGPKETLDKKQYTEKRSLFVPKENIISHLNTNILDNIMAWKGKPSHVTNREARWGTKGSFSVILSGQNIGSWIDFEQGHRGRDLISLYMQIKGIDFKEALKQLSKEYGIRSECNNIKLSKISPSTSLAEQKMQSDLTQKKMEFSRKTYHAGVKIEGTLAERYLREHRGIAGDLPKNFRFKPASKHPHTLESYPALIAPLHNKNNEITGVAMIFLNDDGSKLNTTFKDEINNTVKAASKIIRGVMRDSAVKVQDGITSHTLWVAEGVETALSIAQARSQESVVASLSVSQLKEIPIGVDTQKIVICADNDGEHSHTLKALEKAVQHHLAEGHRVFVAMPPGQEKCDFNDVLKQGGVQAVERILEQRIEIKEPQEFEKVINQFKQASPQLSHSLSKQSIQKTVSLPKEVIGEISR